jgi:cardiolipin synthase
MPHRNAPMQALPAWETEQLFLAAGEWFEKLLSDVGNARSSIDLQTYIYSLDEIGRPILDALCKASERGVRVRLMVDGIGSRQSLDYLQTRLEKAGAALHIYHPVPWRWAAARLERTDWLSRFIMRFARLNNRNHSKLCLVDGYTAWVGSYNISAIHLQPGAGALPWKDAGVRVTGSRSALLGEFFEAVWYHDVEKLSAHFLFHPMTNFSPALRKRRLRTLLTSIHQSHHRIWISSAYFAPVPYLLRALKKASRRGVDVRILVSARSDVPFFPALSSTYFADLLRAGIHIHDYRAGMLHTKLLLVDQHLVIGSTNMNHRSMLHDVELDVEVFKPDVLAAVDADFREQFARCETLSLAGRNRLSAWVLALGMIPRILRYWM